MRPKLPAPPLSELAARWRRELSFPAASSATTGERRAEEIREWTRKLFYGGRSPSEKTELFRKLITCLIDEQSRPHFRETATAALEMARRVLWGNILDTRIDDALQQDLRDILSARKATPQRTLRTLAFVREIQEKDKAASTARDQNVVLNSRVQSQEEELRLLRERVTALESDLQQARLAAQQAEDRARAIDKDLRIRHELAMGEVRQSIQRSIEHEIGELRLALDRPNPNVRLGLSRVDNIAKLFEADAQQ